MASRKQRETRTFPRRFSTSVTTRRKRTPLCWASHCSSPFGCSRLNRMEAPLDAQSSSWVMAALAGVAASTVAYLLRAGVFTSSSEPASSTKASGTKPKPSSEKAPSEKAPAEKAPARKSPRRKSPRRKSPRRKGPLQAFRGRPSARGPHRGSARRWRNAGARLCHRSRGQAPRKGPSRSRLQCRRRSRSQRANGTARPTPRSCSLCPATRRQQSRRRRRDAKSGRSSGQARRGARLGPSRWSPGHRHFARQPSRVFSAGAGDAEEARLGLHRRTQRSDQSRMPSRATGEYPGGHTVLLDALLAALPAKKATPSTAIPSFAPPPAFPKNETNSAPRDPSPGDDSNS